MCIVCLLESTTTGNFQAGNRFPTRFCCSLQHYLADSYVILHYFCHNFVTASLLQHYSLVCVQTSDEVEKLSIIR